MAKTGAVFIFATFIISGISLLLSVVALGTGQWVIGNVDLNTGVVISLNNEVKYGLFVGGYTRTVSTQTVNYGLTITCDFGQNKCAMLCGESDLRTQHLQNLFDGDTSDGYGSCSGTRSLASDYVEEIQVRADGDIPDGFINCGLWLTTVLLLIISCLIGITATLLALLNTVANPVQSFLSISGLFIYNCAAGVCSLIVLVLWGIQFGVALSDNVGIHDTIATTGDSSGKAGLGFSYWFNFVACIGYGASCAILGYRHYLINKEPENIVNLEDKNDNTIILF